MTDTLAEKLLDKLEFSYHANVSAGRKELRILEGLNDGNAPYHRAHVSEKYSNAQGGTTEILGIANCEGYSQNRAGVKKFSFQLATHTLEDEASFPISDYEDGLVKLLADKYELVSRKTERENRPRSKEESKTLVFAPKNASAEKNLEFALTLNNEYAWEFDKQRYKPGPLTGQNITLTAKEEMTPLADIKYATSAVYRAVGLDG